MIGAEGVGVRRARREETGGRGHRGRDGDTFIGKRGLAFGPRMWHGYAGIWTLPRESIIVWLVGY